MADAVTSDQTMQVTRQRREILHRVQSNAMVSQAWTDWAVVPQSDDARVRADLVRVYALLQMARDLSPASLHVTAAEQTMRGQQPPIPPQPGIAPARIPTHEIVSSSGSGAVPRTLNEITYRTPASPLRNGEDFDRKGK